TARTTPITKSAHTTSIAAGLLALPVALLAAAAYGPAVVHGVFHALRTVFLQVCTGSSKISSLPLDAAFAAIVGVIVLAIGMAVRERRAEEDKEVFDIR
ncbi:MAG: hypothetical protein ACTHOG_12210, partial [Marmoricola sp.]